MNIRARHFLLASFTGILAFWLSPAQADDAEMAKEKLFQAKKEFDGEVQKFKKAITDFLDKREEDARKDGNKKLVDKIKAERDAFEKNGESPQMTPSSIREMAKTARAKLDKAYVTAIKEYVRLKMDDTAGVTEKEQQEFQKTSVLVFGKKAFAVDTKYALTGDNTNLTFTGTKAKGKHDGGFKKLTGAATVTDGDPGTLKIEVDIEVDSIYSDDTKLTGHLKGPDFFGVKDNPTATFKTTKVEKSDKGYTITGDLTLLGKTKSVAFPATIGVAGDTLTISSSFKIDRTNWGMTYGKGQIDNDVALKLSVNVKK